MLSLKNIIKDYPVGDGVVHALKGVDVEFRKNEFVAILGQSGCGKTTLLRHILNEQHGYKIAVIENEFGEVSVDDQLIGDRATQIKTLTNGCICCSRSN